MKENYGEKFQAERMRLNLRQSDITTGMGLCITSISFRENGLQNWKVKELYNAYKIFGIDVGFGKVFESIDGQDYSESTLSECTEKEQEIITKKDYETMSLYTLEKFKNLLSEKDLLEAMEITEEEKKKLCKILRYYKRKDGNIQRALKLLYCNANSKRK